MMHVTMENFEESRRNSNRKLVSVPLVPVLDLQQQKGLRPDMDGHNRGFTLLSSGLCKSLKMIEPPSSMLEHVRDGSVCSDPEVTWAVQVLDKLITLAKQWHIVTNPSYKSGIQSIFESIAPKEQKSELQMQLFENTPTESPKSSQEFSSQVQVTDYLKRPSWEPANHKAVVQETQVDDVMKQVASERKLGCSEAVDTHDMECEQGLQETIQEPAVEQNQCHTQIHDDVRTKHILEDIRAEFEQYPPQSLEEFEVHEDDLLEPQFVAQVDHGTPTKDEREVSQHYPSPCSLTFRDSPTSVLSKDDQLTTKPSKRLFVEIPQEDQASHEFYDSKPSWKRTELEYPCGSAFIYRDSPTSTLSAEPDEQPHLPELSDSSEQNELQYPCSSTFVYRDESSDSESFEDDPHEQHQVMKATTAAAPTGLPSKLPVIHNFGLFNTGSNLGYGQQPTKRTGCDMPEQTDIQAEGGEPPYSPGFAYTDSPVSVLPKVSTEEYQTSETATSSPDVDLSELQLFHQASIREPWLQRDGEALDEEDLQFLFPSHAKSKDIIFSEDVLVRRGHGRSCTLTPELQNQWCPSSDSGRSRGESKRHQELSRSIGQLAQDLSKWHSTDIQQSQKWSTDDDDDDDIFPSVRSWEIQEEEEGTSKKTSTRHHRKQQGQKTISSVASCHSQLTSLVPVSTKQRSNSEFVPCSGRLFSWPGQILMFSPGSKAKLKDSSSGRSSVNIGTSFGGSAKRDAHQMRSIRKGSHWNHASVTVADILRGDLG